MISNALFRAVAAGVGLDPNGDTTDDDMAALVAERAVLEYRVDPAGGDPLPTIRRLCKCGEPMHPEATRCQDCAS